jgi:hypothetical protein
MLRSVSPLLIVFPILLFSFTASSQNKPNYQWTTWYTFLHYRAFGEFDYKRKQIIVSMMTDYPITSTNEIFSYPVFRKFDSNIPNSIVPKTTWSNGINGLTLFTFNHRVTDPVLLISSLGRQGVSATLRFSLPYTVVYDGGNMNFISSKTITGIEGDAIIKFNGEIDSLLVYSDTPEEYTNITWGIDLSQNEKQFSNGSTSPTPAPLKSGSSVPSNNKISDDSASVKFPDTVTPRKIETVKHLDRTTEVIKVLKVTSPDITIELYDNGEIDGDSISIYHNSNRIISNQLLSAKPIKHSIHADKDHRLHEILVVAENVGSIPPNTALVIITAGKSRYDLGTRTDKKINQKIVIEYVGD